MLRLVGERWRAFVGQVSGRSVEAWPGDETPVPAPGEAVGAGGGGTRTLGSFTYPGGGLSKAVVLSVPTLQRAHDLSVALIADLPLVPVTTRWDEASGELKDTPERPKPWHDRPDPKRTRQAFLGDVGSDLWAYGAAFARVTSRYVEGDFPASFSFMAHDDVGITGPRGWKPYMGLVPGCRVTFANTDVPLRDVVAFVSPLTGACGTAWRAVQTALALDDAALRYASTEGPAGWLQQKDGEPMGAESLSEAAAAWASGRAVNAIGALNQFFEYREPTLDPDRLQLVEARSFQALELARIGNVPPYLVGAPAGTGMTYQNAQTARSDLVDFGAAPLIVAVNQTLSGPTISPEGHGVRLDVSAWLDNPFAPAPGPTPTPVQQPQEAPA